jgi:hypothetical protein
MRASLGTAGSQTIPRAHRSQPAPSQPGKHRQLLEGIFFMKIGICRKIKKMRTKWWQYSRLEFDLNPYIERSIIYLRIYYANFLTLFDSRIGHECSQSRKAFPMAKLLFLPKQGSEKRMPKLAPKCRSLK